MSGDYAFHERSGPHLSREFLSEPSGPVVAVLQRYWCEKNGSWIQLDLDFDGMWETHAIGIGPLMARSIKVIEHMSRLFNDIDGGTVRMLYDARKREIMGEGDDDANNNTNEAEK